MTNELENNKAIYVAPSNNPSEKPIGYTREDAISYLWTIGVLANKLHEAQLDMYEAFHSSDSQKFVINCSRRLGKSYCLCVLAIEYAMQHNNVRICYAAPTAKAVKKIIAPLFKLILSDCPAHLKPKWSAQDQVYRFPNGSEIHIAGTDAERAESLRGQSMHLGICDEAGFMDDLAYVVSDILMPQTLTTGGRIILASTPAKTPAHDFTRYAEIAERDGNYIKKTIYDNPLITKKTIIKFMMETDKNLTYDQAEAYWSIKSGPNNTTWRREYMAENKTDEDLAIIPEFEPIMAELIQEVERPLFYDAYVGLDIGFSDFTVAVFGYWDFSNARLVIEDEVVLNRMTTQTLADQIKATELRNWGHKKPYLRFSDTDLILITDLMQAHDIAFVPTKKDNKEAAINNLRMLIGNKQFIIHPRCKVTISHLKNGIWNKNKNSFDRDADHGHYDAIDALIYLSRNLQRGKNPIPPGHGTNLQNQFISPETTKNPTHEAIKKAFNLNRFLPQKKH